MTHICVDKLTIIGSDNGLSPGLCQAIIWTSAGILLIGPLRTNFSEILNGIQTFSFKKMRLKMSYGKCGPFWLGLNVLKCLAYCSWYAICYVIQIKSYRKTSNISPTLVGNKIVDNSDVVGASPVGATPTTSSFSTFPARGYKVHLSFGIWCDLY